MIEVEVFRFHPTEPIIKKIMLHDEFKNIKAKNGYRYVAYQLNYNKTII